MRIIVLMFCMVLSMGGIAGCATGGIVSGDGTATGGSVDVRTGDIDSCINPQRSPHLFSKESLPVI